MKENAFSILKDFLQIVERQYNVKVKIIRSDNTLELGKGIEQAKFYQNQEILHQTSCVDTPQQNEVVERKYRYLLEIARALLFQSKLFKSYWGECMLIATHLINRFPSSVLKEMSPYQILFGKSPNYTVLRSFDCLCYASTLKNTSKFDPRVTNYIFLGYPQGQKDYKLLEMDTKRIFVSRDVHFFEHIFPFFSRHCYPVSSPIFSILSFSLNHEPDTSITSNIPSLLIPDAITSTTNNSTTESSTHGNLSSHSSPPTSSVPQPRQSTREHWKSSYLNDFIWLADIEHVLLLLLTLLLFPLEHFLCKINTY